MIYWTSENDTISTASHGDRPGERSDRDRIFAAGVDHHAIRLRKSIVRLDVRSSAREPVRRQLEKALAKVDRDIATLVAFVLSINQTAPDAEAEPRDAARLALCGRSRRRATTRLGRTTEFRGGAAEVRN